MGNFRTGNHLETNLNKPRIACKHFEKSCCSVFYNKHLLEEAETDIQDYYASVGNLHHRRRKLNNCDVGRG